MSFLDRKSLLGKMALGLLCVCALTAFTALVQPQYGSDAMAGDGPVRDAGPANVETAANAATHAMAPMVVGLAR